MTAIIANTTIMMRSVSRLEMDFIIIIERIIAYISRVKRAL